MRYKIKDHVAVSETGIIFDTRSGESYSLNELGIFILGELRKDLEMKMIVSQIIDKYLVDEDALKRDMDEFISYMMQNDLLEKFEE
jgi:hypothetical protein